MIGVAPWHRVGPPASTPGRPAVNQSKCRIRHLQASSLPFGEAVVKMGQNRRFRPSNWRGGGGGLQSAAQKPAGRHFLLATAAFSGRPEFAPGPFPRRATLRRQPEIQEEVDAPRLELGRPLAGDIRPVAAACRGRCCAGRAAGDCRCADRFPAVRADLDRGRAVSSPHAADRRRRHGRDLAVQDRVFAVRGRTRRRRLARSPRPRMGAAHQPAGPAARLCAAVQALRGQPRSAMVAQTAARRLERRPGPAFHDFRAVELPR